MIGRIERALLEEAAYDTEPLHGLLYGLISHGVCTSAREVVRSLLNLLEAGYLEAECHSRESGWVQISDVSREKLTRDLHEYIQTNEPTGFKEYPDGREYYFKTTDAGFALVEE